MWIFRFAATIIYYIYKLVIALPLILYRTTVWTLMTHLRKVTIMNVCCFKYPTNILFKISKFIIARNTLEFIIIITIIKIIIIIIMIGRRSTKRRTRKKIKIIIIGKQKGSKNYGTFYLARSIQGCTQITRVGARWQRLTAFHTRHVAGRRLLFRLCVRSYTYDDDDDGEVDEIWCGLVCVCVCRGPT